jgi:hypothetical protein
LLNSGNTNPTSDDFPERGSPLGFYVHRKLNGNLNAGKINFKG